MQDEDQQKITVEQLARMMANSFAAMHDQFASLENHIGDLGVRIGDIDNRLVSVEKGLKEISHNVDQHRQETNDGFTAVRRLTAGTSHTLTDHEERIKMLEGEYE